VIAMEDWVAIRALKAKNPKMSLREISRLIKISHHTVKVALESGEAPTYKRSSVSNDKLEPFKEVIGEMLNKKKLKGSRILNEIRSKGYTGGKTALYEFLDSIRVDAKNHFTPYETSPGVQSQFDWSPYTIPIAGELTKVIVFSYVNSFSRFIIFEGSLTENQGAVFEAMENSFTESGGVPERVQTDNAKVFVKNASVKNFAWNERYLQFCGHYGYNPSRSLPGHPWSKGKIEKPYQYLETHFIAGNQFENFSDFIKKLKIFQATVNARLHATIKTSPDELIDEDRKTFSTLPETRYVGVKEEIRRVTQDCLLSFGGSRYSVPWMFAGKYVWLRVSRGFFLELYSQANVSIATHTLSTVKGAVVIDKSHYRASPGSEISFDRLKARFLEIFPEYELFIEKLHAQKRISPRRHLFQILEIAKLYHVDDVRKALDQSLEYNIFTPHIIKGILEKDCSRTTEVARMKLKSERPQGSVSCDLTEYQRALFQDEETRKN
jgi:transposase